MGDLLPLRPHRLAMGRRGPDILAMTRKQHPFVLGAAGLAAGLGLAGAALAAGAPRLETAIFAGGCFWTVEHGLEDIPGVVMAEGVPFDWESFPDYLDALERRRADMDFCAQLPHSPLRVYVMGERGIDQPATDADLAVAITGVAGPGGGSEKKPVGTVVFARAERDADPSDVVADRKDFGDLGRGGVRLQAALVALELLLPRESDVPLP